LTLGASLAVATPSRASRLAAVFPPWWPPARAFLAASRAGDVVRVGRWSIVLVVRSSTPGLGDRLWKAGALLVADPAGLGQCGVTNKTNGGDGDV
jgi:hypothetical protein